jgi:hypothetical protein
VLGYRSSDKRIAACSQTDESGRAGLALRYRTHWELDQNILAGDLIKKLKAPASASELDQGNRRPGVVVRVHLERDIGDRGRLDQCN